jgi:hypothetical protein
MINEEDLRVIVAHIRLLPTAMRMEPNDLR